MRTGTRAAGPAEARAARGWRPSAGSSRKTAVDSQERLTALLRREGFEVTQATLSRDLKRLGIGKAPSADGGYTYVPAGGRGRSRDRTRPTCRTSSGGSSPWSSRRHLGLMRTLPGHASSVASALDNLRIREVLGTIAGRRHGAHRAAERRDAVSAHARAARPDSRFPGGAWMKAAVLGATGYTGQVLLRILAEHPEVKEIIAVSSSQAGRGSRATMDPGLPAAIEEKIARTGGSLVQIQDAVNAAGSSEIDVVFSALPHLKSAEICAPLVRQDRCHRPLGGFPPARSSGFPERLRRARAEAGAAPPRRSMVWRNGTPMPSARPISSPTRVLSHGHAPSPPPACAGRAPQGHGDRERDLRDLGSGAQGKDRPPVRRALRERQRVQPGHLASACTRDLAGAHGRGDGSLSLLFTPHMAPLRRGMAVTTVVELSASPPSGARSIGEILPRGVRRAVPSSAWPGTGSPRPATCWGSNRCDIGWRVEGRHLMLFSVIDNLVKGASGQAVQNMNLRFGIAEMRGASPWRASCRMENGSRPHQDRRQGRRRRMQPSPPWPRK